MKFGNLPTHFATNSVYLFHAAAQSGGKFSMCTHPYFFSYVCRHDIVSLEFLNFLLKITLIRREKSKDSPRRLSTSSEWCLFVFCSKTKLIRFRIESDMEMT